MSISKITDEALALPTVERWRLIAQLVAPGTDEDSDLKSSLAGKIDDQRTENWVAFDDLKISHSDP